MPPELGRVLESYRSQQIGQQQYLQRLYLQMIDQTEDELRRALKSDTVDKKFMAAYVAGERRMFLQNELIPLLTDASDPVRQSARRGLIILSFLLLNPDEAKVIACAVRKQEPLPLERLTPPMDFGPRAEATKAEQKKAQDQWKEWWAKPRPPVKPLTGVSAIPSETIIDKDPERLAATLVKADRRLRKELIVQHRDDEGEYHTRTLAIAIANSPSSSRADLREALVARLSTRDVAQLRKCLDDDYAETRRAAVLCLMQSNNKAHLDRIIELLLDPEPLVQRAAHDALCKISGQDLGPKPSATEKEIAEAMVQWKKWAGKAKH